MNTLMMILESLPYVIAAASAVSAVTPTPKDDGIVKKIYKIIDILAINFGYAKQK